MRKVSRHGDGGAQRRGAIEDSGRKPPVARMEPVADDAGAGRELWGLADSQQQPGAEELAEALHEAGDELRERPQTKAAGQKKARPELVDHRAGRQLRKRIGPEEGGEQIAHVRDRQPEIMADQEIGDGERRAVDIVDHAGRDQHGERRTLDRFHPGRRFQRLRHRHSSLSTVSLTGSLAS